ncbi:MAG TPA: hypothetical protein DHW22_13525 [Planctomycetaceae bacterium]|nr:hypothetical protein [Planctomycetaceae bacterium]
MEEPQSWPVERDERSQKTVGDDRSQKTAEKLRLLREQADETLSGHRRRVSHIEAELNLRLKQIAEEIARDRVAEEMEAAAAAQLQEELEGLQSTLTGNDAEIQSLQEMLESQASDYQQRLDQREEELGQLIEQAEQAQSQCAELARQLQKESETGAQLSEDLQAAQRALKELRAEPYRACDNLRNELTELQQQREQEQNETSQLHDKPHATQQSLEQLQAQECADCASKSEELKNLQHQNEELQQQLKSAHEKFRSLEQLQSDTTAALEKLVAKSEEMAALLKTAETRIQELDNKQEHQYQFEQLNRKFELALADVQKLKRENAELNSELASRSAASDESSPELVSLRSERDALADRVFKLENSPPEVIDGDLQQEISDLQRRFELAADDVRQLKQINSKLQEQLSQQPLAAEDPAIDGSDWQAQKSRLLAELDAEEQSSLTDERRAARATIEGTIMLTDQVVAEKDKQIAELQASLEARPAKAEIETMKHAIQEEICSNDELIQTERRRLEKLQQEWQEKLRSAELEISVDRAKLARERSDLEERLAGLQDTQYDSNSDARGKPRHRWLSALGLKEEEEDPQ